MILPERRLHRYARSTMDTATFIAFVLAPIALFGGAVAWAFGGKRKGRFAEEARIPFRE
jgi:cbb3-type cytochrome oxidase subunit 3